MRPKKLIAILFVPFALIVMILVLTSNRKQYVVLVSMDAFRWDYPAVYNTPNFDMMATEGVHATALLPAFPTKTFPNHYTLATGLYPDHHGLVNNSFWAPDLGLFYSMGNRERVENPDFYGGEPIWNTAEKNGMITASMFWVGTEAPVNGRQPTYWNRYDGSIPFEARVDSVISWLRLPKRERPRFITLYFDEPDGISHDWGPISQQTDSVVVLLDGLLGNLRKRLDSLPFSKRINLIVVSDHGMSDISNDRLVNLWKIIPGDYVANRSGSNPVYLIDPAESYQDTVCSILNRTTGVTGYTRDNLPERLHYGTNLRIPGIIAVADTGWSIAWVPDSNYVLRSKATHGWDPAFTDMHGIFYAAGPSFMKAKKIDTIDAVDLYDLICRILKISPAENDGNPGLYKDIMR